MSTNWGITTTGPSKVGVNHNRAMGGISPSGDELRIESLSFYVDTSGTANETMRVGIYEGGSLTNPEGANLIWDAGDLTAAASGWIKLTATANINWSRKTPTWIAWRGKPLFGIRYTSSSTASEDFQTGRGRWASTADTTSTAWPAVYPAGGSFTNAWYSTYLTYTALGQQVNYESSATATFLNLQSGLARPYWEANITISGVGTTYSGTLGQAYQANNDVISMGVIDRRKPVKASDLSDVYKGDITLVMNNNCGTYSPLNTAGIFTENDGTARDYLDSIINIWAGFEDVSGTAYTIQRGSFLLRKLRIDGEKRIAYLQCEDAAKKALDRYIGLPDLSGTASTWTSTPKTGTDAIMADMLSAVGLTANQWDLISGANYSGYVVEEERVADALGKLAQRSDGYIYTNGKGQIVFTSNEATGGIGSTAELNLKDSDRILKSRYEVDTRNLVKKVQVDYLSGHIQSRASSATVPKGKDIIIQNDAINLNSIAYAVSQRVLGQFSVDRYFYQLDNVWLPSLEIGESIDIWDTNTFHTAKTYQIYRIREDIINYKSTIYAISDPLEYRKWAVVSASDVANCGTDFTAHWSSGFGFIAYETTTAVNPAFDLEGNNNNVINTGFSASGAGGTGIELPFYIQ